MKEHIKSIKFWLDYMEESIADIWRNTTDDDIKATIEIINFYRLQIYHELNEMKKIEK